MRTRLDSVHHSSMAPSGAPSEVGHAIFVTFGGSHNGSFCSTQPAAGAGVHLVYLLQANRFLGECFCVSPLLSSNAAMQQQRHHIDAFAPGEFYLPAPTVSSQENEDCFRVPQTNENLRALQRAQPFFWHCHLSALPRTPPLVFLHIPSSAGPSVRMLLNGFASYCGATLAVMRHCIGPCFGSRRMGEFTHYV